MDDRNQNESPYPTKPWDELTRETMSSAPRPAFPLRKRLVLGGLAALLVVILVGTATLVLRDLHEGQPTQATRVTPTGAARVTATKAPTATPSVFSPKDTGWTEYTAGVAGGRVGSGDVKFSASSPQRGYICGVDNNGRIIFGITTDGGQTWVVGQSPAANESCSIQVSPTNALDVALTSVPGSCGGDSCFSSDAHYSADGGTTWKAAPIPSKTDRVGGALWSGAYRYVWASAIDEHGLQQSSFLRVSANGGSFTSIDVTTLLPAAQNVSIGSAVVSGAALYLNLTYSGCSSQKCLAIVTSRDGGTTWAQIPNMSSILLMDVVGTALYGQMTGAQPPTPVFSIDSGATWTTQTLPPLPNGGNAGLCEPAPDTTCIAQIPSGVAYLHAGAWTIIPFPNGNLDVAVALDSNGHPQSVWAIDSGNDYLGGIYWHALP